MRWKVLRLLRRLIPARAVYTYVYKKLAGAAKYPFKAIGSATFDGAWESARAKLQFDGGQKGMPVQGVANSSISHDAQLKEIVGSFLESFERCNGFS